MRYAAAKKAGKAARDAFLSMAEDEAAAKMKTEGCGVSERGVSVTKRGVSVTKRGVSVTKPPKAQYGRAKTRSRRFSD